MLFKKILLALSLLLCTGLPLVAAQSWESVSGEIMPCSGADCAKDAVEVAALPQADFKDEFLPKIARFMLYGMATVAFVVFSAAGAILVLGWGSEDQTKKAKNAMIWGLVGLGFAAAAYTLVRGVLDLDLVDSSGSAASTTSTSSQAAETATATKKSEAGQPTPSTNPACTKLEPLKNPPASCYSGNVAGTQKSNSASCNQEVVAKLASICKALDISSCSIKGVQNNVSPDDDKDLPTNCKASSLTDGKYGQCTVAAIKLYYDKQCGGGSTSQSAPSPKTTKQTTTVKNTPLSVVTPKKEDAPVAKAPNIEDKRKQIILDIIAKLKSEGKVIDWADEPFSTTIGYVEVDIAQSDGSDGWSTRNDVLVLSQAQVKEYGFDSAEAAVTYYNNSQFRFK